MPRGKDGYISCLFHGKGFSIKGRTYPACRIVYHLGCIRIGQPFRSRHRDPRHGLAYNRYFGQFPFICEYCMVRANVQRTLNPISRDMELLMLERARLIDCSNGWVQGTSRTTASNLRMLTRFARKHDIGVGLWSLQEHIPHPPYGPSLLLLWTMTWYTLQPSGKGSQDYDRIRFNSARSLRSGLHQLHCWEATFLPEGLAYRDKDRLHMPPLVGASGSILVQLTISGMERRLGTDSTPSIALQARHVMRNLAIRRRLLRSLTGYPNRSYQLRLAQFAEVLAWLGWLRANEIFTLRWCDVELVLPALLPLYGLPPNCGALLLRLLEATKSHQTSTADHIIAYLTASGIEAGKYFEDLLATRPEGTRDTDLIFVTDTGKAWNSWHFRDTYLYPCLYEQWADQDQLLRTYAATDPELIRRKFYSLSSYRRGGRTHVSRKRPGCVRKATTSEVNEHGRWRSRFQTHSDTPTHYLESTFEDRLYLTLLCM